MIAKSSAIRGGRSFAVALALILVGCPHPKAPEEVTNNCKTNLEMADAQFKACAKGGDENCTGLLKDLEQLATVNPDNKQSADEASAHVQACKGKGEADAECSAVSAALAKLKCDG